jgi:hypothetical protein
MPIGPRLMHELLHYQRNEITEHYFYKKLAASIRTPQNRAVLEKISDQELQHYHIWRQYTGADVQPGRIRLWAYLSMARLLGFTFAMKLMELSEAQAQARYKLLYDSIPEAASIVEDEINHEAELIESLDERHLRYVSSIILGLNDALIELTGALAGLTLALQDTHGHISRRTFHRQRLQAGSVRGRESNETFGRQGDIARAQASVPARKRWLCRGRRDGTALRIAGRKTAPAAGHAGRQETDGYPHRFNIYSRPLSA